MSNSTAFCYVMLMCQQETPLKTNVYHFNWRECFLWRKMTMQNSFFGSGRFGSN